MLLVDKKSQFVIIFEFDLTNQGLCSFGDNNQYQLQKNSRFSFFGCWLNLQQITATGTALSNNDKAKKTLFIYRDSLSSQDFSRLSQVISHMNH